MMHPNKEIIQQFYTSFNRRDYVGMADCYAENIEFSDAVFSLKGQQVHAMWHMLCEKGADLKIILGDVDADEKHGKAHWEADYIFSASGRRVHNAIDASFLFQDGHIIKHHDAFDFWRWSQMAFGSVGWALGWTPLIQKKVQRQAKKRLDQFMADHPEYLS
ncbi:nuclear transport factor 2 family protein [Leptothrix ochracea]|uniref:nuclear transport factor 2 family protein n=1 Tax=Leptothrix ochracea TaxID=735331 RepID=UPI0034E2301E